MDLVSSNEQSYSQSLTSILRATVCTNATNFNDEQNPKIYFNNPRIFDLYFKIDASGDDYLITCLILPK
jgi:hypothetical protein